MVTHRAAFQGLPLGQDLIFFDDFFVRPDLENGGALVELSDPAINALSSRAPGGERDRLLPSPGETIGESIPRKEKG